MQKDTKKEITEVLEALQESSVQVMYNWGPGYKWYPLHGLGTSSMNGYKLGDMLRSHEPKYRVGVFRSSDKNVGGKPIIEASWSVPPTKSEMISALLAVRQVLSTVN